MPYYKAPITYDLSSKSGIAVSYSTDEWHYICMQYGEEPDPEWIPITEEQIIEELGFNPLPWIDEGWTEPEPDPPSTPDPTMTQMAAMIVETNLNVEYLVANMAFSTMKGGE